MPSSLVTRDGDVATVTLNRPAQRNALDETLKTALLAAVTEVGGDDTVRAVVLAAEGPAFCVGQDLAEHAARLAADGAEGAFRTVEEHYSPIVEALATMPKPVVAAVHGTCVGAGLGLALACDLRVFAEDATLGTAFTGIGLTCDSGLSATLTRSVGESRARELVLLGTTFKPADAVGWGISGQVVAAEEVASTAAALAARLASGPTTAYAESKRLLAAASQLSLAETLAAEAEAQVRCGATEDHRNAVDAFMSKARPTFTGR
ncbi:2-(1,2-epoxy-1,2-dihydrophenyl)acetyl-CoA isomerase [Nocardioides terrae]|uniref:2-(1,2-epoxy-1,2-dihydrophenyl)acetyl-CoA isomerase n=1 Tax=Nocardioides terrae TaxID=574651 RepID=A0A1I1DPJ5_9ACTN|nr:enoyl-CoA hydratase-related protein [Nocardioides terrae]SFB76885.1 2-(1,2-epoxy-1,2-dihydrophenyl)acetyl-CoA isomerase [Nocardioides terrae]